MRLRATQSQRKTIVTSWDWVERQKTGGCHNRDGAFREVGFVACDDIICSTGFRGDGLHGILEVGEAEGECASGIVVANSGDNGVL